MSKFKIILTAVFAVCFVVGLIFFAAYRAGGGQPTANLTVWGVISPDSFNSAYKASSVSKNKFIVVNYVQKDPTIFDSDFVEALADGAGPDAVILREDSLYKNRNKFFIIPYASYPMRTFKDQFIQEGEMFLTDSGVIALPLSIDPMVMYWNRDIFSNNSIAQPPQYWDQIYGLVNSETKKDSSANVMQSAVAFGGYDNITNAKGIISMLLLQAGTPIVSYNKGVYSSAINSQLQNPIVPGQAVLDFYTQFSNPTSASYSWNRSLPASQSFFLSGKLAMYFGFAGEIFSLQQKNPNLNFDVTAVPQIRNTATQTDFAHMYAVAIVKQSKNITADFTLVTSLTEPSAQTALASVMNLPPVRRDLLSAKPTDAFRSVFYNSALISRSWTDPDSIATAGVFRDMISGITSGQTGVSEALSNSSDQINALLQK